MTGAMHYAEAERLLFEAEKMAHDGAPQTYWPSAGVLGRVAAAHVHATLALSAATAESSAYAHDLEHTGYGR